MGGGAGAGAGRRRRRFGCRSSAGLSRRWAGFAPGEQRCCQPQEARSDLAPENHLRSTSSGQCYLLPSQSAISLELAGNSEKPCSHLNYIRDIRRVPHSKN